MNILSLIKIDPNDIREALLEVLALAVIVLSMLLFALVFNYIKRIKADRKTIVQERKAKKRRALEKEQEAMANVYERYCNDNRL